MDTIALEFEAALRQRISGRKAGMLIDGKLVQAASGEEFSGV